MSGLVELGAAFRPRLVPPPAEPDPVDRLAGLLLDAFAGLQAQIAGLVQAEPPPVPQVQVDAPDLSEIVAAVNGLKPSVDADEIAAAIARVLRPSDPTPDPALGEVVEALKMLDFRMKGMGSQAYGGGASQFQHLAATGNPVQTGVSNPMPVTGTVTADTSVEVDPDDIYPGTVTSGTTEVVAAPGAGFRLRVYLVHAISDADAALAPVITFQEIGGRVIFKGQAIQQSRFEIPLAEATGLEIVLSESSSVTYTVFAVAEAV
jgi:hypothetical protein